MGMDEINERVTGATNAVGTAVMTGVATASVAVAVAVVASASMATAAAPGVVEVVVAPLSG